MVLQDALTIGLLWLCGSATCQSLTVETSNGPVAGQPATNISSVAEYLVRHSVRSTTRRRPAVCSTGGIFRARFAEYIDLGKCR